MVPTTRERAGRGAAGSALAAAFYLLLLAWLLLFVVTPAAALRWEPVVITSGSMAPAVRTGDVVLLEPFDGELLAPGTVIAYQDRARGGDLTLHRVVGEHPAGGYRTKGDANAGADSTPVQPELVVGVGRLLVPMIGLPARWLATDPVLFTAWLVATGCAVTLLTMRREPAGVTTGSARHTRPARPPEPAPAVSAQEPVPATGLPECRVGQVWTARPPVAG